MAHGPRYRVPLKRRREGKTDYYQRRELLKSGSTRAVIRGTQKNMHIQFVDALPDGDVTRSATSSRHLKDYGWKITGGNIPAAYITGYLAGKKALAAGVEDAIADLGLQVTQRGGRLYAALKGLIDAGIEIPVNDEVFPNDETIEGQHIMSYSSFLSENRKDDLKAFAKYSKEKQKVDGLDKLVKKTKDSIDKKF